jgi:hypothetical protein
MVITESRSALEEWHNLPSPPPTFHPDRPERSKEKEKATAGSISISNALQSSGSSLSNTLTEGDTIDWSPSRPSTDQFWNGGAKSAHATDAHLIARKLLVDLQ